MSTYTVEEEEKTDELEGGMSFLDHLDELRSRLIRIASFLLIAFVICWAFSDKIYHFLEIPVREAMINAKREAAVTLDTKLMRLVDLDDGTEGDFTIPTDTRVGSAIIQTGTTVRVRVQRDENGTPLLVTTRLWVINEEAVIPEGFVVPRHLYLTSSILLSPDGRLVVQTVQGAFNLYIKVSFYAAVFFGVPFFLGQIWGFVAPGLYPHEKKYAAPFIIMTTGFFLIGCAFAYKIAFPRAAGFLLDVAAQGNLRPLVSADEYFDLIITIMLGLGIVFQIPSVTFFLARMGIVTPHMLLKFWKYALILIFIVAAVLSPTTDIPNLLVFAAPMMLLYGLSVGIAWMFHRKRRTEELSRPGPPV
ncbi:MAG TPA: twin-arginine translocase subunit TatC [Blastocatellia bacterium]|jgi:sec-independent protein translocase protein TatC|nr:twin-arginine translocase subunit TatC [Blastocatellia bacterium]